MQSSYSLPIFLFHLNNLLTTRVSSFILTTTRHYSVFTRRAMSSNQFVDIGANLLDDRYQNGVYRGTFRHDPDLDLVLERAQASGVRRIVLTAGTVTESRQAVEAARQWNATYPDIHFSCTVGVHPTRC